MGKKFLMVFLVFIIGCQTYGFKDGFKEVSLLDKKYNTSLYTEALDVENVFSDYKIYYFDWNRTIIKIDYADRYINDLNLLKEKIESINANDMQAILLFIDARIHMLESEKLYLQGRELWDMGNTVQGFGCRQRHFAINLSNYYNESSIIGQNSTSLIDKILTNYPVTRDFFTGSKRPKFYDSPFWPIRKFAINNKYTIEQFCKSDTNKG